jgi:low molecular weight protein-tyrosine phosphatase
MPKLLFVCMGNICRSPAAEGVMLHHLKEAGLDQEVTVDSAGTLDYHTGNLPDFRMRRAASQRGLTLTHRARQVKPEDLSLFDLILVMDHENLHEVMHLLGAREHAAKIKLFCEFCTEHDDKVVPDPYYGGPDGFERVLDLLEDGCAEITRRLQAKTPLS